jgi:RNA polymerase sigma-70 factor (ECF subfamily)
MGRFGRFFRPHLVSGHDVAVGPAPVRRDDAARFREEMLPHMDAAYSFARFLARDPVAAEDIAQDAFLRAFRAFPGYRGEAAKPWLLAIVRNCFRDWASARRDRPEEGGYAFDDENPVESAIDHDDPEAIMMRRSEADGLRSTIAGLPEPFREALVLRELEELSYREIAAITGVPMGTVMSRLARAREMLAALLLPEIGAAREVRS